MMNKRFTFAATYVDPVTKKEKTETLSQLGANRGHAAGTIRAVLAQMGIRKTKLVPITEAKRNPRKKQVIYNNLSRGQYKVVTITTAKSNPYAAHVIVAHKYAGGKPLYFSVSERGFTAASKFAREFGSRAAAYTTAKRLVKSLPKSIRALTVKKI